MTGTIKMVVFYLLIGLALLPGSAAFCQEYALQIQEVIRSESCYESFNVVFEEKGCESDCFTQVESFVVRQGDRILSKSSGIRTTFYAINFRNPDCSGEDVAMIMYGRGGEVLLRQDFILEQEHGRWQEFLAARRNLSSRPAAPMADPQSAPDERWSPVLERPRPEPTRPVQLATPTASERPGGPARGAGRSSIMAGPAEVINDSAGPGRGREQGR